MSLTLLPEGSEMQLWAASVFLQAYGETRPVEATPEAPGFVADSHHSALTR